MLLRICVTILCFVCVSYSAEYTLKAKIQPQVQLKERGNYNDSGSYHYGFHRIKLYNSFEKKLSEKISLRSMLSLDFSERNADAIVKEARILLLYKKRIEVHLGQYKLPFYYNDYCGSSKIAHVSRSFTSEHLRHMLSIGGYKQGFQVIGSFWDEHVTVEAGLFYSEDIDIEGVSGSELFMLPQIKLECTPFQPLKLMYSLIMPNYEAKLSSGEIDRKRVPLHTFSLNYEYKNLYKGGVELFVGPDTVTGKDLLQLQESYDENLSFSLYSNHIVTMTITEKFGLRAAIAGEFLNGLTYIDSRYQDRSFNYALWGTIALSCGKNLSLTVTVNERFDNDFKALHEKEIYVEGTFTPTFIKRKK